uniref:Uncharacterized protein n=1 Tax=Tetraselmis sp. GSL018 TaxID=582737 RepID=A0A061S4N2_9CHLO|eukprot:CAMPEP_0177599960 /NCGR_PEP_ID=MMETSP0419_2-20121207/13321_1 /TAXON_ID=582737 /ORGANISM="Tetraselmis sp., Strain GSL018" /LENGTH=187 /DNA_ID=CAMNT_0019092827 /DNA_START=15 /DNA_END=578 /DNA_ORIENTATION=-
MVLSTSHSVSLKNKTVPTCAGSIVCVAATKVRGVAIVKSRNHLWTGKSSTRTATLSLAAKVDDASGEVNGTEKKDDKRALPFTNTNKFLVPEKCRFQFEMEWKAREANMKRYKGFNGLKMVRDGAEYTVSSSWQTVYDWESWSTSIHHRRSHLPVGVKQYPPAKGTGFPETFIPLIGLTDRPMLAQY